MTGSTSPPMTLLLLILVAGLLFTLQMQTLTRLKRAEERLAALHQELDSFRGKPGQAEQTGPAPPAPSRGLVPRETLGALFERMVGGKLLIWIGGIALAAAGIFLIRHSIELVTPEARMVAAGLFGLLLIGAGEYAKGGRLLADDPRIGQALVGAGIAVLYATIYGSYLLFDLLGNGAASASMLLVTAAALGLSLRHGGPTALMGLVGGFLTPLLVGDPQAGILPLLAYLALLDAAIFGIAWWRGWNWLAAAATAASFAWTGYYILEPPKDALAAGLFAGLLAIVASLPRATAGRQLLLMQPAIIGLVELAILVARGDIGLPAWLLFLGLAASSILLSAVRPASSPAPAAALLLGLLLLAFKAMEAEDPWLAWAAAGTTMVFAGGSAPLASRGKSLPALIACGGLAGPLLILRLLRPELLDRFAWGWTALALSAASFGLLRLVRGRQDQGAPAAGPFAAAATAALLLAFGAHDLAPRELISAAWLLIAIGLMLVGTRIADKGLRLAGLLLLTVTIIKVFLIDAAALEGALRILSFLGLGGALIAIGRFYPRVLNAEGKAARGRQGPDPASDRP